MFWKNIQKKNSVEIIQASAAFVTFLFSVAAYISRKWERTIILQVYTPLQSLLDYISEREGRPCSLI